MEKKKDDKVQKQPLKYQEREDEDNYRRFYELAKSIFANTKVDVVHPQKSKI